jgi:hypothetical protein
MQVDIDALKEKISEADKLFLTPKAEATLTELLELRAELDRAIKQAKESAEKILSALKAFEDKSK